MFMPKFGFSTILVVAVLFQVLTATGAAARFNPRDYSKKVATCQTRSRGPGSQPVELSLRYVDINPDAGKTILMVHGWPSLWSSWASQIEEFKNDYGLVVPDLRGFGESTHPGDPRTSGAMPDLVKDLVCILEHAKIDSVICMGHDWGSQVCFEAARMRPDVFHAVIGVTVPYIPSAGAFLPLKHLANAFPKLAYQLYFDTKLEEAAEELDRDVRRTLRATLRTISSSPPDAFLRSKKSFLDAWKDVNELPAIPFFSKEEEDYFVEQYKIQGFKNTLYFYMSENRRAAHNFVHKQGNYTVPSPVLSVLPLKDPVANWVLAAELVKTADFVPNLTTKTMEGSHWVHMEHPKQFNAIVRKWLHDLGEQKAPAGGKDSKEESRVADEL